MGAAASLWVWWLIICNIGERGIVNCETWICVSGMGCRAGVAMMRNAVSASKKVGVDGPKRSFIGVVSAVSGNGFVTVIAGDWEEVAQADGNIAVGDEVICGGWRWLVNTINSMAVCRNILFAKLLSDQIT